MSPPSLPHLLLLGDSPYLIQTVWRKTKTPTNRNGGTVWWTQRTGRTNGGGAPSPITNLPTVQSRCFRSLLVFCLVCLPVLLFALVWGKKFRNFLLWTGSYDGGDASCAFVVVEKSIRFIAWAAVRFVQSCWMIIHQPTDRRDGETRWISFSWKVGRLHWGSK